MTRDEVRAAIDAMLNRAKALDIGAAAPLHQRGKRDGFVDAARMLEEALEKSEAPPVECAVCNWVDCACPKAAP